MKLKGIEIEAFRGYQNKVYFDFLTSQGLIADIVVIFAPNGFGKTSFFDAVEWGLTDKINRFESKILTNAAEVEKEVLTNRNSEKPGIVSYFDSEDNSLTRKVKKTVKWDLGPGTIDKSSSSSLKGYFPIKDKNHSVVEILPQNAVDEFVFSTSPEDRYKALTGFWDGYEDTKYFQGVAELWECHKEEVLAQEARIETTRGEITKYSSSEGQISSFNSIIKDINSSKFAEPKFTEVDAGSINSTERFDELKEGFIYNLSQYQSQIISNQSEIDRVTLLYSGHAKYITDVLDIEKIEKQIGRYTTLLEQFRREAEWKGQLSEGIKIFELWEDNLMKLTQLAENRLPYLENLKLQNQQQQERATLVANNLSLTEDVQKVRKAINNYSSSQTSLKSKIEKAKEDNIFLQRNFTLFSRNLALADHSQARLDLCQRVLDKKMSILLGLQSQELGYRTQVAFSAGELVANAVDQSALDTSAIKNKMQTIANLEKGIIDQEAKFFKSGSLSENLQKIIEFGKTYVSETETSTCPLCTNPFNNFHSLLEKIETQKDDVLGLENLQADITNAKQELATTKIELANELETIRTVLRRREVQIHLKVVEAQTAEQATRNLIKYFQDQLSVARQDIGSIQRSVDKTLTDPESINAAIAENDILIAALELDLLGLRNKESGEVNLLQGLLHKLDVQRDRLDQLDSLLLSERSDDIFIITEEILADFRFYEPFATVDLQGIIWAIQKDLESLYLINQFLEKRLFELRETLADQKETEIRHVMGSLENQLAVLENGVNAFDVRFNSLAQKYTIIVDRDFLEPLGKLRIELEQKSIDLLKLTGSINELLGHLEIIEGNLNLNVARIRLKNQEERLAKLMEVSVKLEALRERVKSFIDEKVNKVFNQEIINDIYQKIDPHPELKNIKLDLDFNELKPKLTIRAKSLDGKVEIDPVLYLSSAQINILSLSIFLAKALQNEDTVLDTIFMDDPIQYLDSINILSFLDLLRVIVSRNGINRQLVLSTHDEQFFRLLKKKFDPQYYLAKFIEFETYGTPRKTG